MVGALQNWEYKSNTHLMGFGFLTRQNDSKTFNSFHFYRDTKASILSYNSHTKYGCVCPDHHIMTCCAPESSNCNVMQCPEWGQRFKVLKLTNFLRF